MTKRITVIVGWFSSLILLFAAAFWLSKPTFSADMFSLLPKSHSQIAHAEDVFFQQNANRIMFSFAGNNKNKAFDDFQKWLDVNAIKSTFNFPSVNDLAQTFSPFKHALLSDTYKQILSEKTTFEHYYLEQLNQLGNPFVSATLSKDTSLSLAAFIEDNLRQSQLFTLEQGRLTRRLKGVEYRVILANLAPENLGVNKSIDLADTIIKQINILNKTYPDLSITYSGVLFHTAENAKQAKYEMSLFGGISLLALIVMVFWVFRRLNSILLASFTVLSALIGGAIAMVLLFNTIHLLTLVFAVTLIGIAIDYAFHGMTDLAKKEHEKGYSRGTQSALLLSLITTTLGYLCLLGAPLTLLSQVGVFVIAGLVSAWLFTVLVLPLWQSTLTLSPPSLLMSQKLIQVFLHCNSLKKPILITLLALISALFLIKPISFNDDVKLLNASSEHLMLNEKKHLLLLGQWDSQIVFMFADSDEALLQKQEQFLNRLTQLNPNFKHNSISHWLPSLQKQRHNQVLFEQAKNEGTLDIAERVTGQALVSTKAPLLTYETLATSTFKPLLLSQMVVEQEQSITWVSISGISADQLINEVEKNNGIYLYNKPKQISALLSDYREYLLLSLVLAGFISWLLFSWRFTIRIALLQVTILSVVVLGMLWICNAIQGSLSLFNLLGALLVIALAIDYLVFYQINKLEPKNVLAISLSAASSMWVFGMLSASDTPAIFSFGLSVMVGILAIYFLSPLSVVKPQKEQ